MKSKILRILILFFIVGVSSFMSLQYLSNEMKNSEQRKSLIFKDHVNKVSLLLKKRLDQKNDALSYLMKFFAASNNVSYEEFVTFSKTVLKMSQLSQICWKNASTNSSYHIDDNLQGLCQKTSLIDRIEIVEAGEGNYLGLTEFTNSFGGDQKGAISIFFNLRSLFPPESKKYYEEIFITNIISDQMTSYKLSNVEAKEYIASEVRELVNLGSLKIIYFAKRPKSNKYFYGEYNAALIAFLLVVVSLLVSFYFWNSQTRHEQIQKEVVRQTKKISKANSRYEALNTRYELALSASQVGIWDWNLENREMICDEMVYSIYGLSKDKETQSAVDIFQNVIYKDDKNLVREHLIDCLKYKKKFSIEYRIKRSNQEIRYIQSIADIFYKEDGIATRMVGAIWDITESKTMENELKRSNEDLDQFAYIASHDLREPLRGMRNFSQFLVDDYSDALDEEALGYLDVIQKLGKRLENYLDSLLYYSRLGREKLAFKEVELAELIPEIHKTYLDPSVKNVEIRLPDNLPRIKCDPIKLTKILGNLFQNAIRYNHSDKKIIEVIYKKLGEDRHQFWVKDNGIGIKPEHWNRIFTIFKRLHPKDEYDQGSGLGLAMAKKAAEQHSGDIWVESSELGTGSCFSFTIKEVSELLG